MGKTKRGKKVDLTASIRHLRSARRRLKDISDEELDALPPEKRKEWARLLQEQSVAITKLETADLQHLSQEFLAKEPQLRATTTQLDEDLGQLTDAVSLIAATSAAMKTVTVIVSLLA
jgi:hypothetical protein